MSQGLLGGPLLYQRECKTPALWRLKVKSWLCHLLAVALGKLHNFSQSQFCFLKIPLIIVVRKEAPPVSPSIKREMRPSFAGCLFCIIFSISAESFVARQFLDMKMKGAFVLSVQSPVWGCLVFHPDFIHSLSNLSPSCSLSHDLV